MRCFIFKIIFEQPMFMPIFRFLCFLQSCERVSQWVIVIRQLTKQETRVALTVCLGLCSHTWSVNSSLVNGLGYFLTYLFVFGDEHDPISDKSCFYYTKRQDMK